MASDGCQPVPGDQAFPYILQLRKQSPGPVAPEQLQSPPTDKIGTWNGPKPTGLEVRAESGARAEAATVHEPETLLLRGGARLPLLGFGTYKVGSVDVIKAALAAGYRAFDAAPIYGNEAVVGQGLQDFIASGLRSELFLTTKIWNDGHQPDAVRASCRQSVAELGCDYIDLLLMHWPEAWLPGTKEPDTSVTIQQTWHAMEELVDKGLVRNLGVANFSLAQLEALLAAARIRPVVLQVELHPLLAQRKLVGVCMRKGVRCVAYSPLGHGSTELFDLPEVQQIASETGRSPAQVLLRWNCQRGVPVIPRSSRPENIYANANGLFQWRLTDRQKAMLDKLDCGKRMVDNDWHEWGDSESGGATRPSLALS